MNYPSKRSVQFKVFEQNKRIAIIIISKPFIGFLLEGRKKTATDTRFYIEKLLGKYLLAINVKANANRESRKEREPNCMEESEKIINLESYSQKYRIKIFFMEFLVLHAEDDKRIESL